MTGSEARSLKIGDRILYNGNAAGRISVLTGVALPSMVTIAWDSGNQSHIDPDFMEDYSVERMATPPPTPHARKRPNITLSMLEGLRFATLSAKGIVGCDRGSGKGLERRGLATWSEEERHFVITESGRLLIRTQYQALKQVLPETREGWR